MEYFNSRKDVSICLPDIVTDVFKTEILSELALSCVAALDAEFVSVDIVEDECGFEVLEINSGVMMKNFAASNPENYEIEKTSIKKRSFTI